MSQGRTAPSGEVARPGPSRQAPNYAARRMLVSTITVALVLAASVLVWRALRDGSTTTGTEAGDWNEVVFVDRTDGATVSVDRDGNAGGTATATARTVDAHVEGARLALVGTAQIALTDLGGESPQIVPIESGSTVTRLPIADSLWLAVSDPNGGNFVLVDGLTGTTYDFGALADPIETRFFIDPLRTLRFDLAGNVFAAADSVNFQTVVVDTSAETPEAQFFQDQPLAISPERVVTSQVVGQRADLTLFAADSEQLASVTSELTAGAALDGDDVVVASLDGAISRFGQGDEETERIGAVAVPAGASVKWVQPIADGSRWVVFGDVFEAIVDLDGRTIFTTTFTTLVEPPTIQSAWSCLPVGGGSSYHSIVSVEQGDQVADLTGLTVTGISADGCTVVGTRAGSFEVVGDGGTAPLGRVRSAALAPDGRAVVVQTTTNTTELITIEDDWTLGEPVDLSEHAPANAIIGFRQT